MAETIALIGLGEAGSHIGRGLAATGQVRLRAYDLRFDDPALTETARAAGISLHPSPGPALEGADFVFSLVTASAAVDAARAASGYLRQGQVYIDFNSVSPMTKRAVAEAISPSGATFVEAAIMAPVPGPNEKVAVLAAGREAAAAAARLNALGMKLETAGERIGDASLSKMLRSVFIKGIEALMLESLTAARRAGVEDRILASVQQTLPGIDWRELAFYNLGRTVVHGARRAAEMRESAATIAELGLDPFVTEGIARRIEWAADRLRAAEWPNGEPRTVEEILDVLADGRRGGQREAAE